MLLSTSEKKAFGMSHKNRLQSSRKYIDNRSLAHSLADAGYAVFPCKEAGPKGVIKSPYTKRGFKAATLDHDQIDEWWDRWPGAVPGLPTGRKNGIGVLDIDKGHGDGRDGERALEELGFVGSDLSHLRVMTPGGGKHLYFSHVEGMTNSASHLPKGIDIRVEGGYVIAPQAVMADGSSYEYITCHTLTEDLIGIPVFPRELRQPERVERTSANDNDRELLSIDELTNIVYDLDFDEWCDAGREPYFTVIAAIHDATGGSDEGKRLSKNWAEQSKKFNSRDFERDWESFKDDSENPITVGSLIPHAPTYLAEQERKWRKEVLADFLELDSLDPPANPLVILTPDACDVGSFSNYVVKGLFGAGEIGTIVGAPGVGKSALAASMAYAVAQGDLTFGMRTREGPVFYLACENETDMKRRVKALHDNRGAADNFRLVLGGGGNLKAGSKFHRALLKQIERDRPVLVVIDTLAAAMPGFEENSSEGMGQAIAVAKSLGKFGAAVVVVHHDTKAGDGLPRGHSSLNGIVDVNLALRRNDDGIITGECSKNRSGKSHEQIVAYENRVVELGFDQDGDAITTVICEETETSQRKPEAVSKSGALALRILKDCMQGASAVSLNVWRDACMEDPWLKSYDKHDTRRKTFRRAKEDLEEAAHIAIDGENVRVIDQNRADVEVEEFGPRVVRRSNRHREIEGLA